MRLDAANYTWDLTFNFGSWSSGGSWLGNSAPPKDGSADVFMQTSGVSNLDSDWSIRSLQYKTSAGGFILSAISNHVLTLGTGGINNLSQDKQTIKADLKIDGDQEWRGTNIVGDELLIEGDVTFLLGSRSRKRSLTLQQDIRFDGEFKGVGNLKLGSNARTITFSDHGSLTQKTQTIGLLTIDAGTLDLGAYNTLTASIFKGLGGVIQMDNAAEFNLNSSSDQSYGGRFTGGGDWNISSSGTLSLTKSNAQHEFGLGTVSIGLPSHATGLALENGGDLQARTFKMGGGASLDLSAGSTLTLTGTSVESWLKGNVTGLGILKLGGTVRFEGISQAATFTSISAISGTNPDIWIGRFDTASSNGSLSTESISGNVTIKFGDPDSILHLRAPASGTTTFSGTFDGFASSDIGHVQVLAPLFSIRTLRLNRSNGSHDLETLEFPLVGNNTLELLNGCDLSTDQFIGVATIDLGTGSIFSGTATGGMVFTGNGTLDGGGAMSKSGAAHTLSALSLGSTTLTLSGNSTLNVGRITAGANGRLGIRSGSAVTLSPGLPCDFTLVGIESDNGSLIIDGPALVTLNSINGIFDGGIHIQSGVLHTEVLGNPAADRLKGDIIIDAGAALEAAQIQLNDLTNHGRLSLLAAGGNSSTNYTQLASASLTSEIKGRPATLHSHGSLGTINTSIAGSVTIDLNNDFGAQIGDIWKIINVVESTGTRTGVFSQVSFNTSNLPAGSSLKLVYQGADVEVHLVSTASKGLSYSQWATALGLSGAAANKDSDTDGDGLTALEEYAYGTNPLISDTGNELSPHLTTINPSNTLGQDRLAIQFNRPIASASRYEIAYLVQSSDDLTSWLSVRNSTSEINGNQETLIYYWDVPISAESMRYYRVKVEWFAHP